MRYFKTKRENWLYFKFDEDTNTMYYSGSSDGSWKYDTDDTAYTPETINFDFEGVPIPETNDMFCVETDENWNPLN